MSLLRSEDWSVKPSFVPNGPTSPVVLLIDDTTLTQLAGIPPVAWQTPWSELGNLELVKFSSQMAFFATVNDVRYCWRHRELTDYESMRTVVLEHGGAVTHRRRKLVSSWSWRPCSWPRSPVASPPTSPGQIPTHKSWPTSSR